MQGCGSSLTSICLVFSFSDKQTEGNARLYRFGCLLLTILCLILLLVVIILSMKREYLHCNNKLIQDGPVIWEYKVCHMTLLQSGVLFCSSCLTLVRFLVGAGSTVCGERQETAADSPSHPFSPTCSYEQCQAQYPSSQRRSEERTKII